MSGPFGKRWDHYPNGREYVVLTFEGADVTKADPAADGLFLRWRCRKPLPLAACVLLSLRADAERKEREAREARYRLNRATLAARATP